jgi:signal transduction histidine kinase
MDGSNMKLASTYQRFYFVLLCILLAVGCLAYYISIRYVLIHQVDNDLKIEQQELLDFVRLHDSLPAPSHYRDQQLQWKDITGQETAIVGSSVDVVPGIGKRRFENALEKEGHDRGWEPIRRTMFRLHVRGKDYMITISKSLEETEDLLWLILWVTAGSFMVLLAGLYIGNRFLLRRIWQPFYQILDYLGHFSLAKPAGERPVMPAIDEFALLYRSVEDMTEKMQRDYMTLQQFTDHAAHEMQTPLAIIKGKLDLMMQHSGLDEQQYEQIQQLHHSVGRLSRLNQSLLLLARIENRQYLEKEPVALRALIEEKLDLWQEWIRDHGLTVIAELQDVTVGMHPFLAESLVNNLLSNAVRHNVQGGEMRIWLKEGALMVFNTGQPGPLDTARLFLRFQKQHPSEGVGLGLAIVKEIVELSGMDIRYGYTGERHTFTVLF